MGVARPVFFPLNPTSSLAIPNNAAFLGTRLFAQGILLAPNANALGVATTNGIRSTVGGQ